ncbi:MAG: hypothetical protein COT74_07740 [Bdellovibrionales bacterium CG10_big_fil_rev_8_21_14_0_10_45_34]|nr:MAG: hypothetical protein COT74_07740 [Bdellovibrionales bacterium CG10_big_fil_rev_8_21_14_0_10_45_34]
MKQWRKYFRFSRFYAHIQLLRLRGLSKYIYYEEAGRPFANFLTLSTCALVLLLQPPSVPWSSKKRGGREPTSIWQERDAQTPIGEGQFEEGLSRAKTKLRLLKKQGGTKGIEPARGSAANINRGKKTESSKRKISPQKSKQQNADRKGSSKTKITKKEGKSTGREKRKTASEEAKKKKQRKAKKVSLKNAVSKKAKKNTKQIAAKNTSQPTASPKLPTQLPKKIAGEALKKQREQALKFDSLSKAQKEEHAISHNIIDNNDSIKKSSGEFDIQLRPAGQREPAKE